MDLGRPIARHTARGPHESDDGHQLSGATHPADEDSSGDTRELEQPARTAPEPVHHPSQ